MRKVLFKIYDILVIRTAPGINALVIIAYHRDIFICK